MTGDEEQDAGLKDPALRSNLEPTARETKGLTPTRRDELHETEEPPGRRRYGKRPGLKPRIVLWGRFSPD